MIGVDFFRIDWFDLLGVQGTLSRVFSHIIIQKHQFLAFNLLYSPTLVSVVDYWKNHSSDHTDLVGKVMSFFNTLSRGFPVSSVGKESAYNARDSLVGKIC